jgi:hypothetical protein
MLEYNYVGFLSFGGSHILFRDITGKMKYPWVKYYVTKESQQCRAFYSMESEVDIFTEKPIIINLSEGVFDALGIFGNLGYSNPNTLNIAVCGKHYVGILTTLVKMGFVGDNIIINIFADNDEEYNTKNKTPTTIEYFRKLLYRMKGLYGRVNVYYNRLEKDFGVTKDKISIKEYRL